ncbi:hypothetical protein H6F89_11450 [Cyanobacteria bacterium FACHB-63]|nr:hypothetical protein [Cyanobacteria bacterium FACHB-63]
MSKTFQVTVPNESYAAIQQLMEITGHERPGALFALLVRRYGGDLARCLGDYVPHTPDIVHPKQTQPVPMTPDDVLSKSDYVPHTPDIMPSAQDGLSLKDKMKLLSKPSQQ